jgi:hypothetical protein
MGMPKRAGDRSWAVFWLIDGLIGLAAAGYVTVSGVRRQEPIAWWEPVVAYGGCLVLVGLLALCYWSLRQTSREKARGER